MSETIKLYGHVMDVKKLEKAIWDAGLECVKYGWEYIIALVYEPETDQFKTCWDWPESDRDNLNYHGIKLWEDASWIGWDALEYVYDGGLDDVLGDMVNAGLITEEERDNEDEWPCFDDIRDFIKENYADVILDWFDFNVQEIIDEIKKNSDEWEGEQARWKGGME
jgi:hypothetical protein